MDGFLRRSSLISDLGSSRSPNTNALYSLQASTQAGISPFGEPFIAECAFFHNAASSGRVLAVEFCLDKRTRVPPVQTAGAIRACRHTVPASDTPVVVHHDNTVRASECGLGRAHTYARGVVAMIAQDNEWKPLHVFLDIFLHEFVFIVRKSMIKRRLPDPFDFVLGILHLRDIVNSVAGIYAESCTHLLL